MQLKEKVSVIVATYQPVKQKVIDTLQSIVIQKGVDVQIIVTDDGSDNNLFDEIRLFFKEKQVRDYVLLASKENQGTVKNVLKAINVCHGTYVKTISPGDCLYKEDSLQKWIMHLRNSGLEWSMGDAIYYKKNQKGMICPISQTAHPIEDSVYLKKKTKECIWNYLVLDDIALGAAVISTKKILEEYLKYIEGKVVYAEDNVYRIMMFDKRVGDYFPEDVILYEYGDGVSTSGNVIWEERLQRDWKASNEIMLERIKKGDELQAKIAKIYRSRGVGCKVVRVMKKIFEKGRLRFVLRKKLKPRMTTS